MEAAKGRLGQVPVVIRSGLWFLIENLHIVLAGDGMLQHGQLKEVSMLHHRIQVRGSVKDRILNPSHVRRAHAQELGNGGHRVHHDICVRRPYRGIKANQCKPRKEYRRVLYEINTSSDPEPTMELYDIRIRLSLDFYLTEIFDAIKYLAPCRFFIYS